MSFGEPPGALLLTPGAGSDRDHSSLLALEAALAPMPVVRVDFPYRRAGRKAPDRAPRLVACVVEEAAALAETAGVSPDRVVVGGRSMGGSMCSMAVAQGLPSAGLVLISYPLHPPGRPERMRMDHFPAVNLPCLFVSGTRDPFATPDELEAATAQIAGPVTHLWIEGTGHGLEGADARVAASVAQWLTGARCHPRDASRSGRSLEGSPRRRRRPPHSG
ncbi:MAG TPA: alpha/beta family hydrolase [Acidimicrobiales bacterium]|nr:alpha/beta family hydrolase [Acidimicrobiales bacterium]